MKSDSCIREWGVIMQPEVKSKNCRRLPGPLKGQSGKKITYGGAYYLHRSDFYEIKSKELEKKCHETVFAMEKDIRIKSCGIKSRNSA